MGYACPVCETPQSDAEHLANHLAFAAILGDDEHESWLDEHAPGWNEAGSDELAPRVAKHAAETEYPQVFEDTVHDQGHDHGLEDELQRSGGYGRDAGNVSAETQAVLDEARRLTEEMLDEGDDRDEDETE